jgi:hypothetical protein
MDLSLHRPMYEEVSVSRPQMVIELKTCDILTLKKKAFIS